jgi:hypothetical protein
MAIVILACSSSGNATRQDGQSRTRTGMVSFLLAFLPNSYIQSPSIHACVMPCSSHSSRFNHSNYTCRRVKFRCPLQYFATNLILRWGVLSPMPNFWRTTPCRPSATAYSVNSLLPSIPGGLFHPQLKTRHAMVTRDLLNMVKLQNYSTVM